MNKIIYLLLSIIITINSICIASESTPLNLNNNTISKITVNNIEENQDLLNKFHNKYKKYLNKTKNQPSIQASEITSKLKGYKKYDYPLKDNFNKNNKKILIFALQDGDYALLDTNIERKKYQYAAEYHQNGELFGIVQIKTFHKKKNSAIVVLNEYRNKTSDNSYIKKHTVVFEVDKTNSNIAQFIYEGEPILKNLICAQINETLFLNKESKNLLVEMQKFDTSKKSILSDDFKNNLTDAAIEILATPIYIATMPLWLPAGIYLFSIYLSQMF